MRLGPVRLQLVHGWENGQDQLSVPGPDDERPGSAPRVAVRPGVEPQSATTWPIRPAATHPAPYRDAVASCGALTAAATMPPPEGRLAQLVRALP